MVKPPLAVPSYPFPLISFRSVPDLLSISQYPTREESNDLREEADFGIHAPVEVENVFGDEEESTTKHVVGLSNQLPVPRGKSDGKKGSRV